MTKLRTRQHDLRLESHTAPGTLTEFNAHLKDWATESTAPTQPDRALNDQTDRTATTAPARRTATLEFAPTEANLDYLLYWDSRPDFKPQFNASPRGRGRGQPIQHGRLKLLNATTTSPPTAPTLTAQVEIQDYTQEPQDIPHITLTPLDRNYLISWPTTANTLPQQVTIDLADHTSVTPPGTTLSYRAYTSGTHPDGVTRYNANPCIEATINGSNLTLKVVSNLQPGADYRISSQNADIYAYVDATNPPLTATAQYMAERYSGVYQLPRVVNNGPEATGRHRLYNATIGAPASINPGAAFDLQYYDNEAYSARYTSNTNPASLYEPALILTTDGGIEIHYNTDVADDYDPFTTQASEPNTLPEGTNRYWALSDGTDIDILAMPDAENNGGAAYVVRDVQRLNSNGDPASEITRIPWRDGTTPNLRLTYLGATFLNDCAAIVATGYRTATPNGDGTYTIIQHPPSAERLGPGIQFPFTAANNLGWGQWGNPNLILTNDNSDLYPA